MNKKDYIHQLPGMGRPVGRPVRFWDVIHLDAPLVATLLLLICSGLFILYSASSESFDTLHRQVSRFAIGATGMVILAQVPPAVYKRYTPWLYLMGITLLFMVLLLGTQAKGAQRWIHVPGIGRFQPSEIMKLAVPMMTAWYLNERALPPPPRPLLGASLIIFVPVILIANQPDLGTSLLIASSGIIVLLLAGLSWRIVFGALTLCIPLAIGLWFVMHDYQRNRVLTFLKPERDTLGTGWNINQSKTAIGSGGIDGKGWLNGTQSQLDFLPESSTDFIVAVLAEELGLIGICLFLGIYLMIIMRGLYISVCAQDTYSRLVAGSIILTFFVYLFVNIGMVSGLLPVVGVPLPMVSYGGTSIVTLMAGFGVLMSIHTHRKFVSK